MASYRSISRDARHVRRGHLTFLSTCVLVILAFADAWNAASSRQESVRSIMIGSNNGRSCDHAFDRQYDSEMTRRKLLQQGMVLSVLSFPRSTRAATVPTGNVAVDEKEGLMTASAVADLLRPVPTFTIVDQNGIPFTVVGEDAKVTGYFFTTYAEASRILKLAKDSADKAIAKAKADKEEEIGANPWKGARISTVPLDYAITLVIKSMRSSGKGVYFKMAPADKDVDDALGVTGDEDLAEGKVPMFYYEDFKIAQGGDQKTPLYFRKEELQEQWSKSNPNTNPPKIQVTELLSVIMELVRPGGNDEELKNLLFVPPRESETKRKECLKKGGNEPAFVVGKRIIVL